MNQPEAENMKNDSDTSFDGQDPADVFGEKKMLITGLVKKMKYYFLHNTRQLILYSNSTLEYHDPYKNTLRGIIKINNGTKIEKKDDMTFTVTNPDREFLFKSLDIPAHKWVTEIRSFLQSRSN